jgi:hypothetical protein
MTARRPQKAPGKPKVVRWREGIHTWNAVSVPQGQEPLTTVELALCLVLSMYVSAGDDSMAVRPSQATLATALGVHRNTISSTFKRLQALGLVAKVKGQGPGSPVTWWLLMHPTMAGFIPAVELSTGMEEPWTDTHTCTAHCACSIPTEHRTRTMEGGNTHNLAANTHNSLEADLDDLEDLDTEAPPALPDLPPTGSGSPGTPHSTPPRGKTDPTPAGMDVYRLMRNQLGLRRSS